MGSRWQWIIGLFGLVMVGMVCGTPAVEDTAETNAEDGTTKPPLTGNPQIDYKYDPNLPHELKTYDLSDYPFYSRLPEDLLEPSFNFSCDDRLDGFYASVPHKCQVYHNCLFNQRYDFLCANYTVFDQKNFICHYVSEVDCANSANHYDRNEELYVTTTTTTPKPAAPQIIYIERPSHGPNRPRRPDRPKLRPFGGGNRRPGHRRTTTTTPPPDYYDDYYYDQYYDDYYNDYYNDPANDKTTTTTTTTTTQRPRRPHRPQRTRLRGEGHPRPGNVFNAKDRKRPRINPPVPVNDGPAEERPRASRLQQSSPARQQDIRQEGPRRNRPGRKPRPGAQSPKQTTTTTTTTEAVPEEDYYDYYDYADEPSTTTTAAPTQPSRPSFSRPRPGSGSRGPQNRPGRKTTTTTTSTEAPTTVGHTTRPGRVNVRKNPVNIRRTPLDGARPLDNPQEAASPKDNRSQGQRPQRFRPHFPRSRTQNEPSTEGQEAVIVEEEPPVAPVDLTHEGAPTDTTTEQAVSPGKETGIRSRTPIRRLGQSGPTRQGSGPRVRDQQRPPTPDYYDY